MRNIPTALANHIQGQLTTLCVLWKIRRRDGVILGFADHPKSLVYDDLSGDGPITYHAVVGFARTDVRTSATGAVDHLDVVAQFDSDLLREEDLRAGRFDGAEVSVYAVNYNDLAPGRHIWLRRGWFGEVTLGDYGFQVELRGLAQRLDQTIGEVFTHTCRADLGDARCKVALAAYTHSGTVATVIDRNRFTTTDLSGPNRPADWFAGGKLTWTSGSNQGTAVEIRSSTATSGGSATFTFFVPPIFAVQPGDSFTVTAGCDKRVETCRTKFNNILNFRGEPFIPGREYANKYAIPKS